MIGDDKDRSAQELGDEALEGASGGAIRMETTPTTPSTFTPDPGDGRLADVKLVDPDTLDPAGTVGEVKPEVSMTFHDVSTGGAGKKNGWGTGN